MTETQPINAILSYRANEVYNPAAMRAVEQSLRLSGVRLDTISFPQGTEAELVSKGVRERTQRLLSDDTIVIADRTTASEFHTKQKIYLDDLAAKAALATLPEDFQVEESATLENAGKVFKLLMTEAIEKIKPEVIYIDSHHLGDHGPFSNKDKDEDYTNLPKSYFDASYEHASQKTTSGGYKAAKIIKQWLAEIGFEGDVVIYENPIGNILKQKLTLYELQREYPDTWFDKLDEFNQSNEAIERHNSLARERKSIVLHDRHYGFVKTGDENPLDVPLLDLPLCEMLALPLSDLVKQLIQKGIIKGDPEKFVPELARSIQEKIQSLVPKN